MASQFWAFTNANVPAWRAIFQDHNQDFFLRDTGDLLSTASPIRHW